jgi:xanthine dehydrogenase YagT iron-sulfur-binding subunit
MDAEQDQNLPPQSREDLDELLIFGDPETRRTFLKRMAGTGAALAVGPTLLGLPSLRAQEAGVTATPARAGSELARVTLKINGKEHALEIDPRVSLLDALREHLNLTGSKKGCDHGQCGACTVLVNGRRINSCLSLALVHEGDKITTIEGLATGEQLHPVQAAFLEHDGFQCGYCTPGQICSAVALLQENHANSDGEIREWMSGNLCRCGAYPNIVAAIRQAKGKSAS